MKFQFSLLCFVVGFSTVNLQGQIIEGQVIDFTTGVPLVYVNIGVMGTDIGTTSNENGTFKLKTDQSVKGSKVRFSMIGYKPQILELKDLTNNPVIRLIEETTLLNEVMVRPSKRKLKQLGTGATSKKIVTGWGGFGSGGERGIKIESKSYPIYPTSIRFHVANNEFDSILLRLHIRSLKGDLPDLELLQENILVITSIKSGWVEIDVSNYNLILNEDFVISLEWLRAWGKCKRGNCLLFSLNYFKGTMYAKEASEGFWRQIKHKSPGILITFDTN